MSRTAVAIAWAAWLLSLVCLFLRLGTAGEQALGMWITSDSLYPVNVFTDTVLEGRSISGWKFSIAPCWVPDLVLTWLFMMLTGNVILATLLAGFVQVGLIAVGLRLAWKATGSAVSPIQEALVLAAGTAATLYVALHPGTYYPILYQLFLPQTHIGSMVLALWALAIGLRIMRKEDRGEAPGWVWVGLYAALCYAGGLSNLFFSVQTLAPLTVMAAAAIFFGFLNWRSIRLALPIGWISMFAGFFSNRTFFDTTDLTAQSQTNAERVLTSLDVFMRGFVQKTNQWDLLHSAALLGVVVCLLVVLVTLREAIVTGLDRLDTPRRFRAILFGALALSGLLSATALILGGSNGLAVFKDYQWSMHYMHSLFILPLFTLPFAAGAILDHIIRPRLAVPVVATVIGMASLGFALGYTIESPASESSIASFRTPLVRHLDELAQKEQLRTGLAGYWQARLITLLSTKGVRAYAIDGTMSPLMWVSNAEWYEPIYKAPQPRPDFVVLDDPLWKLDAPAAYGRFGQPLREVSVQGTRVLLYKCATCARGERKGPIAGDRHATAQAERPASTENLDQPLSTFVQKISATSKRLTMSAGHETQVRVTIANPGQEVWVSKGRFPVTISYKFYSGTTMLPADGERTVLPTALKPGEARALLVRVRSPEQPGDYRIRITLVQEGVAWFMTKSNTFLELPVTVQ